MTKYVIEKPYVYVVLEHARDVYDEGLGLHIQLTDCVLHGVYTDRGMAEGKRSAVKTPVGGYISILKKPINGMIKKSTYDSEEDEGLWDNCKYLEY